MSVPNPKQLTEDRIATGARLPAIERMFAQFEAEAEWTESLALDGVLQTHWLPAAAKEWIRIPPTGTEVKRFRSTDPHWGDVIVWKSTTPDKCVLSPNSRVQVWQELPTDAAYWAKRDPKPYYGRSEEFGRLMSSIQSVQNKNMAYWVEGKNICPSQAKTVLAMDYGAAFRMVAETFVNCLVGSLPSWKGPKAPDKLGGLAEQLSDPIKSAAGKKNEISNALNGKTAEEVQKTLGVQKALERSTPLEAALNGPSWVGYLVGLFAGAPAR
ncbi:MAG: hypothetical protein HY820_30490 [Acidobacteria bacterium]|nr:hypothetical protein [Acidobacteriota bacterium]